MSGSEPYFEMLKREHRELDIEGVVFKPVTVDALVEACEGIERIRLLYQTVLKY